MSVNVLEHILVNELSFISNSRTVYHCKWQYITVMSVNVSEYILANGLKLHFKLPTAERRLFCASPAELAGIDHAARSG